MERNPDLPIPAAVQQDGKSVELARIWAAGGKQYVSLATGVWSDPAAWGIMLADLARHIADAYWQAESRDPTDVLARIKQGFDAEWGEPTDRPDGELKR
jgi:uncharacterized membrane protein